MSVFHIIMTIIGTYVVGFAVTAFVLALFNGEDKGGWTIPVTIFWPITLSVLVIVTVFIGVYALPTMLGENLHKKLTPDGE